MSETRFSCLFVLISQKVTSLNIGKRNSVLDAIELEVHFPADRPVIVDRPPVSTDHVFVSVRRVDDGVVTVGEPVVTASLRR